MIQFDHDLLLLGQKLGNEFESYPKPEKDPVLAEIESANYATQIMNTNVQYTKYLAHVQGRMRALKMRDTTRNEAFSEYKEHIQRQKNMYEDLKTIFQSMGGLIQ